MSHPNYPDHDVICPSLEAAKLWLEENEQKSAEKEKEKTSKSSANENVKKDFPPILRYIKPPQLASGKSSRGIALFLQTKHEKDLTELFYELGKF